jgi:hypothetical protein
MTGFQVLIGTDRAPDTALLDALVSGTALIRPDGNRWVVEHPTDKSQTLVLSDLPHGGRTLCWRGTVWHGASSPADAHRVGRLAVEAALDGLAQRDPHAAGGCTLRVPGEGDDGTDIVVTLRTVAYR